MWLGLVVASILGLALLVALGAAIRLALRRSFGIALAIALPTCLIGYFFVDFAGDAAMTAVFGDPNVMPMAEDARQVSADELQALFEGRTHVGMYYDGGTWLNYRETYLESGGIRGKSGPENNPDQWTYSGQWKVENGQICQKYDGDFDCANIFVSGDTYMYALDPGDDIRSWFVPATPVAELEPGAEQLTGDTLRETIENRTLRGRVLDAAEAVNFAATFFANNHAIYTLRGDDPDRLDREEYGWYRFAGDRVCLSDTLGTHQDCFAVFASGDSLSFVLDGSEVTLAADRPL
jgi:hypothetical protein